MTRKPLDPDAQRLFLEITKQLITLAVASIGVLSGLMFTALKGAQAIGWAAGALVSFVLCAAFGVLCQLAVLSEATREEQALPIDYPKVLLMAGWALYAMGITAFITFALANVRL